MLSGHPPGGLRRTVALAVAFPSAIYLAATLGYTAPYSQTWYIQAYFHNQYDHGVYKYRVIGRALILAVGKLHLPAVTTPSTPSGELFDAFLIVNGAALLALSVLLYRATVARNPEWLPGYLILIAAVVASGYVVTPYDDLSYLLLAATCLVTFGPRPAHFVVCAALGVLAMATRESDFLAVAAAVGYLAARWPTRERQVERNTVTIAVVSVATYVGLRLVLGGNTSIERVSLHYNLHSSSLEAFVIWALLAFASLAVWPTSGGLRAGTVFIVVSVPYLLVSLLGGVWFETPRLLMPLLVAAYTLRSTIPTASERAPTAGR